MNTPSFAAEQRHFFHARCFAMREYCNASGLHPLVIMGWREVFDIFCDGNRSGALQYRPVNDNRPAYPP